uniref:peptide-methionine (S)-S-oxide reductase n=1 Tax=Tetraselmis sp. GSL018 TaxID=582737 RepID=A0A061SDJ1_9CHLO|eukprot:CAMPEP_0177584452 /NCGR_PEP_ID=MMETSP0419_2-20121207/3903_1 /TAXON_ID=582737 /ORGANISM="Tetraselmis sp., Strain GSL018" /LENGTH=339 /DNA_ID=CAMNT_0019073991 /DNA_START=71 /DNA_END=1090 /DNA_ORIENTATION=-
MQLNYTLTPRAIPQGPLRFTSGPMDRDGRFCSSGKVRSRKARFGKARSHPEDNVFAADGEVAKTRRNILIGSVVISSATWAVSSFGIAAQASASETGLRFSESADPDEPATPGGLAVATFAGGCFWCMEGPFDKLDGVVSTTSGYTGGEEANPSYQLVSAGVTGHAESIQVLYDPKRVSYATLLDVFWHQIDPTTPGRQFCDRGNQYRSAIFPANRGQERLARESLKAYEASGVFGEGKRIVTEISPLGPFWEAEGYHQDYYLKNPELYRYYRTRCGRDDYLRQIWGDDADVEEPASPIPPPQLLLKYAGVGAGAWLGGALLSRVLRSIGNSNSSGSSQ